MTERPIVSQASSSLAITAFTIVSVISAAAECRSYSAAVVVAVAAGLVAERISSPAFSLRRPLRAPKPKADAVEPAAVAVDSSAAAAAPPFSSPASTWSA